MQPFPGKPGGRRAALTSEQIAQIEIDRGIISVIQSRHRREKLAALACSSTWADDQWERDRKRNPRRFFGTRKRPCCNETCGRLTPPQDLKPRWEGGPEICTDCRTREPVPWITDAEDRNWQRAEDESATILDAGQVPVTVRDLEIRHVRLVELELPLCTDEALRGEIERYLAGHSMNSPALQTPTMAQMLTT